MAASKSSLLIVDVSEVKLPGEEKQNTSIYLPNVDTRLTGWTGSVREQARLQKRPFIHCQVWTMQITSVSPPLRNFIQKTALNFKQI
jgi:hypothetical protein